MSQVYHRDDDYLPCNFYQSYTPNDDGFAYFAEGGKFYFAYMESGEVVLRSEGYSSEAARENGVQSVLRNKDDDSRYVAKRLGDNRWVLSLTAANHQEIARSCPVDSEDAAKLLLPSERKKRAEQALAKAERVEDDYLICREYREQLDKVSEKYPGFIAFQHENGKYYFAWVDGDEILMRGEGYQSAAARDNGIEAVMRNWDIEERFSVEERHGAYFGVLRAGNKQEIARSCPVDSEAEARRAFPSSRVQLAAARKSAREQEDYLGCSEYQAYANSASELHPDFIKFQHENGKYYFAWMHNGEVYMRSEGYTTAKACDNGIESVIKNRDDESKYSVEEVEGLFYTVLKAGNRQEIARSCPYAGEAEAKALFPSERAKAKMMAEQEAVHKNVEDDYLPCREYESYVGHRSEKYPGFIAFQHTNGKYYFAWVNDQDQIVMRGEGYPSIAARDNGIESVIKNRELDERYKIEEKLGWWYLVLKAGNHQEIARSCPKPSQEELHSLKWVPAPAPIVEAVPLAPQEVAQPEKPAVVDKENDYLNCSAYQGHAVSDTVRNYAYFRHENGLYYFVIYNSDGSVRLRSEGFTNTDARDNELSAALRNLENKERYVTLERGGYRIHILKDENGREVGRSCPEKIVVDVPVVAPVAAAAPVASKDKEDDYLPCDEYKGHKINDKINNIAFFKHKNGQYYFVVYNQDGSVRLRSEGFRTSQERDVEVSGVLKNINKPEMYETIEKAGYVMRILRDHTGREVGRSCPEKVQAAVVPPVVVPPVTPVEPEPIPIKPVTAEPEALATIGPEPVVKAEGKGISPWWLLLLLLPLLWFLLRGCDACNKPTVPVPPPPPPPPAVIVDTTPAPPPAPVCNCAGQTDPVFALASGIEPKVLQRLGTNPEFGNSHGLSDAEFYDKLNKAYQRSKVDRLFLDRISAAMGYTGWADIKPEYFTSVEIPYGTIGNIGYSKAHKTLYAQLNTGQRDLLAFRLKANNGCDLHFMKTCGNHFFYCNK